VKQGVIYLTSYRYIGTDDNEGGCAVHTAHKSCVSHHIRVSVASNINPLRHRHRRMVEPYNRHTSIVLYSFSICCIHSLCSYLAVQQLMLHRETTSHFHSSLFCHLIGSIALLSCNQDIPPICRTGAVSKRLNISSSSAFHHLQPVYHAVCNNSATCIQAV